MWKIPLFDGEFVDADYEAVQRPLRENWLTMGQITRELEKTFAGLAGSSHAIAVSSGTSALHLALQACGIGRGHEVICPSLTFVASANAARYCGARVVFAEVLGEHDLTVDPADVRKRLTPKTRAIMAVHYAGFPAQMEGLMEIAKEHDLIVIEDCAHALFTTVAGQPLGSIGSAGAFSFFSNKNMTSAEGGVVTTNDDNLAEKVRLLRSHGMTSLSLDRHEGRAWSYDCVETGWNFRIDEIRSSLALTQLQRLDDFLERRAEVRQWYREELDNVNVTVPFTGWDDNDHAVIGYHIMPIVLAKGTDRLKVMEHLKAEGIQTSIHYPPAHRFTAALPEKHPALPITESIAARELTLPFYPKLTREDVRLVCSTLAKATS